MTMTDCWDCAHGFYDPSGYDVQYYCFIVCHDHIQSKRIQSRIRIRLKLSMRAFHQ